MSYPRNATSPPTVAVGSIYLIADGTIQTAGASVRVLTAGGVWGAAANPPSYDVTSGIIYYTPSQAETNGEWFIVAAYKASCTSASVTVVTEASTVSGTVKPADGSIVSATFGTCVPPAPADMALDSTVAKASTALTNATWTDVKAGYLDAAISSRGTSTYAGGDTAGTTTLLSRIPQAIAMAQVGGVGAYYVEALTDGGSHIHPSGAAVAKSPATLAAADVTGNLPADLQTVKQRAVNDVGLGNTAYLGTVAFPGTWPASWPANWNWSTYAGGDTAGTTTLLTRIPQALAMAQIGGVGAYYVQALTSDGAAVPTAAAIAAAVWALASAIDGKTPTEVMQIIAAIVAGKVSGAGTGTEVFKGVDGVTTRATVTVDGSGNRTAVTY